MRVHLLLSKFGAASVAGLLTLGGGLAFAEAGDTATGTTTEAPAEEGTVTIPVEETVVTPTAETPVEVVEQTPVEVVEQTPVEVVEETPVEVIEETPVEVIEEEPAAEHVHPENHGKHVSETAKTAPKGKGGAHGKAVSEVARSDAGKKHAAESGETEAQAGATSKGHGKK